jgi:hypothetical protein
MCPHTLHIQHAARVDTRIGLRCMCQTLTHTHMLTHAYSTVARVAARSGRCTCPTVDTDPAVQLRQTVAPDAQALNLDAGQLVQVSAVFAEVLVLYMPAVQLVHTVKPGDDHVPAVQLRHTVAATADSANFPAGQSVHSGVNAPPVSL